MVAATESALKRIENEPVAGGGLMPVMSIKQAVDRYNQVLEFATTVMKEDRDFGKVPGTDKPTLLKPGAEKLCTLFGLAADFEEHKCVEDWDRGLFYYAFKAKLINRDGRVIGTGIGSCNSREKKYRYRLVERVCPECQKPTIKRSKFPPRDNPKAEPGFYCFEKVGGCGANFAANDTRITEQVQGRVENDEPFDLINTIQKMSQKRALVAAVLVATNASEYFTQDLEDQDYIDTPAKTAASTQPSNEIEYVLTPDGDPDLSHDQTFHEQWRRIAVSRQINPKSAENFLQAGLNRVGPEKSKDVAWRAELLNNFREGKFDASFGNKPNGGNGNGDAKPQTEAPAPKRSRAKKQDQPASTSAPATSPPATTAAAQTQQADPKLVWEAFIEELKVVAKDKGIFISQFSAGVARTCLDKGIKGRESEMKPADRQALADAVKNRTGYFAPPQPA